MLPYMPTGHLPVAVNSQIWLLHGQCFFLSASVLKIKLEDTIYVETLIKDDKYLLVFFQVYFDVKLFTPLYPTVSKELLPK